ncbi:MAG TPA: TIGR04222 domain-containing membrane protein [Thermoanaerobaculia bacterium]|jgi:uncharacterized protein (TIGR04222 family)
MNPLDMTGPEFLRFYLIYGVAGLALAALLRILWTYVSDATPAGRRWTPGYYPHGDEGYGIALLRGGRKAAIRTLLGRLVTSGPLSLEGGELRWSGEEAGLSSLERRATNAVGLIQTVPEAERRIRQALAPELARIESDLESQGLIPTPLQRKGFWLLRILALLAIPGLGLAKLAVALARGKTNVLFLILMLAVYTVAALLLLRPPRLTRAGRRYLAWLRESHQGLVRMIEEGRRGENPGEAALAAGIFGLTALPALALLHGQPQPRRRSAEGSESWGTGGIGADSGGDSGGGDFGGGGGDSGGGDSGGGDGGGGGGDGGGGGCGGGCGGCGGG